MRIFTVSICSVLSALQILPGAHGSDGAATLGTLLLRKVRHYGVAFARQVLERGLLLTMR